MLLVKRLALGRLLVFKPLFLFFGQIAAVDPVIEVGGHLGKHPRPRGTLVPEHKVRRPEPPRRLDHQLVEVDLEVLELFGLARNSAGLVLARPPPQLSSRQSPRFGGEIDEHILGGSQVHWVEQSIAVWRGGKDPIELLGEYFV